MFFRSLGIHVSPNRLKRSTTDTANEIRPVPEQWFGAVKLYQMFGKPVSCSAGAGRPETVDQYGYIQCRMDVDQQMHMIRFATKFQQPAAPSFGYVAKGGFKIFQQFRCQCFATIFSYKNDMQFNVNTA